MVSKHPWGQFLKIFMGKKLPLWELSFLRDLISLLIECTQENNLRNAESLYSTDHQNYIFCRALGGGVSSVTYN